MAGQIGGVGLEPLGPLLGCGPNFGLARNAGC